MGKRMAPPLSLLAGALSDLTDMNQMLGYKIVDAAFKTAGIMNALL